MLRLSLIRALPVMLLSVGAIALSLGTEDPKCPEGAYAGFESNVWQFSAPATEFINKTGSFFRSEWYLGPLTSTHGKDNTPGSTRTAAIGNTTFTEQLIGYWSSPTQSVIHFSSHNVNGGPLVLDGFKLLSYTEEFRVMSICGGTATHFSMTATYCTDSVVDAYDFYDGFRRSAVDGVAKELKARVFTGTCPVNVPTASSW